MRGTAHQRGYDANWRRVRAYVLDTQPLCVYCLQQGQLTEATVVDHIIPIRERPDLRLDTANLQSLCKLHHDSTKEREERLGTALGCDQDGNPNFEW